MWSNLALSPEYNRSLRVGAILAVTVSVLACLVLDGGLTAQITLMAVLAYFGGVALMVVRRPQAPTATDLWLLRWGFLPLWLAVQVSARFAWYWLGRI